MPLVHDADVPDPFLLAYGDRFYCYATNSDGKHVPVLASSDLRSWTPIGDAVTELPGWAEPGRTWSPAVLVRLGHLVLYAAVRDRRSGRQVLATWVGEDPAGPFRPREGAPLLTQIARGGCIDPDPFVDVDGSAYLVWKSDGNAVGAPTALWSRRLRPDGLGLDAPRLRAGARLLRSGRAFGWEHSIVEAPTLLRAGGDYLLFYSGGPWESPAYGIGWASGDSPTGRFTRRTPQRPWLTGSDEVAGPGGQCVLRRPEGAWLGYHGWEPDRVGYRRGGRRGLYVDRLLLTSEGPQLA